MLIVCLSFQFCQLCFTYFEALFLGACMYRIVLTSLYIDSFAIMKSPFLFLVVFLVLLVFLFVYLSDVNGHTPDFQILVGNYREYVFCPFM